MKPYASADPSFTSRYIVEADISLAIHDQRTTSIFCVHKTQHEAELTVPVRMKKTFMVIAVPPRLGDCPQRC